MRSINDKQISVFLPESPPTETKKPPKSFLDRFKGKLVCTDPRFSVFKKAPPPPPVDATIDSYHDSLGSFGSSVYATVTLYKKVQTIDKPPSVEELQDFMTSSLEDVRDEFFIYDDTNRYTAEVRLHMTPLQIVLETRKMNSRITQKY
ncbi:hypothetical protein Cantr_01430 [Candida viswanathii]|uniref:Uncharacterized protein n=1 Tax=Candida viswanathii TaxID=5486 RepID=A0A367YID5_9ASCO|nr:hypothetical protein Cantr_01430 [Candida viswanathii]